MPSSPSIGFSGAALVVRQAETEDIPGIQALTELVYRGSGMGGYGEATLRGQLSRFPEGQFVVALGSKVVGYCATFIISGEVALKPHTWTEITGGGFASRHDPDGDYLYGMEVCVHPDYRGLRIGQRLYNERKKLCREWRLKGIVFVGRVPTWHRRARQYGTIEHYIEQVSQKQARDPVLSFQLRNGFEVIGVIDGYLPHDFQSLGVGIHMMWKNPQVAEESNAVRRKKYGSRQQDSIRVAAVQYMQRRVSSFEEYLEIVRYFVDVVSSYSADFVLFPEMFSLQLLSISDQKLSPAEAIEALTTNTPRLKEAFREMAVRFNVNIIGGSHPTMMPTGRVENVAYIFLRSGEVFEQPKIHPTPNEVYWWNIEGGDRLQAFDTDCGPIGVLICYDAEFPELGRYLVDQGAQIIFVPFCTDERQSYLRVRYCCQARAVENQCFVVMAGNVGNLPRVANMDIQYAQSCILTPCDFPFARDGVAADTTPNTEMVSFADLRLEDLRTARNAGTVQNLRDRRHDLYQVVWRRPPSHDSSTPG